MKLRLLMAVAAVAAVMTFAPSAAVADTVNCDDSSAGGQAVIIHMSCPTPGGVSTSPTPVGAPPGSTSPYVNFQWATPCHPFTGPSTSNLDALCQQAQLCAQPGQTSWNLWGQLATGRWTQLGSHCFTKPPTPADLPKITITPAMVLTELRRIGLPALTLHTQPANKTLVNFDTIFYTQPTTITRTLHMLGQTVTVQATPTSYQWHFGDNTTTSTHTPGARYPAKDILHRYADAATTMRPSVDVTYTGRFHVGTGPWQDVTGTVTIPGPTTNLRVVEATPVLSGQHN